MQSIYTWFTLVKRDIPSDLYVMEPTLLKRLANEDMFAHEVRRPLVQEL